MPKHLNVVFAWKKVPEAKELFYGIVFIHFANNASQTWYYIVRNQLFYVQRWVVMGF